MRFSRILVLATILSVGGCEAADSGCSEPQWPFYARVIIKDRLFHAIGSLPQGLQFVRPAGCDFMFVASEASGSNLAALDALIRKTPSPWSDTVITGRFDGEIIHLKSIDAPVVVITQVRGLRVVEGKERDAVLDSRFWPPRRVPDLDPAKPAHIF